MTCSKLQSEGFIEWRGWPFFNFFIILVVVTYLGFAVYKKLNFSTTPAAAPPLMDLD